MESKSPPRGRATSAATVSSTSDDTLAATFEEVPREAEVENVAAGQNLGNGSSSLGASSWANLLKQNRQTAKGIKLGFIEEVSSMVEEFPDDEVDGVQEAWGASLIGYVAGKFPGKGAILELGKTWSTPYKHYAHPSGWLIFKFDSYDDMNNVWSKGPYFVFGRPLMLKEVPHLFEFDNICLSTVPTWVTLPGLPIELWNGKALTRIASRIGKPVVTDHLTAEKLRLSYARVLVEVDVSRPLVRNIDLKLPNGKVRHQEVHFGT